jgi:Amt family ammonium transporter
VFALAIKARMNWDDSLDVIAVHLVGGVVGTLLLGVFADTAVNGDVDGLAFGGGFELLKDQFVAAVSVAAFSFAVTFLIATAIQRTMGLRVPVEDELLGLDQSQHAESAYSS